MNHIHRLVLALISGIIPAVMASVPSSMESYHINYVERGRGQVIILLHGLGGDWKRWKRSLGPLSKHYRVIALDQLGFGESDKPKIEYSDRTLAKSLYVFMKAHGLSRATVVGNSMGAGIAYAFAVDHPEMLDKLVIVGGSPTRCSELDKPDSPFVKKQPTLIDRKSIVDSFESLIFDKSRFSSEDREEIYRSRMASQYASLSEVRSFVTGYGCVSNSEIAGIQARTLIIWGRNDTPKALSQVSRLQSELKNAQVRWIDRAAHLPHMEQPEAFADAVTDFLGAP